MGNPFTSFNSGIVASLVSSSATSTGIASESEEVVTPVVAEAPARIARPLSDDFDKSQMSGAFTYFITPLAMLNRMAAQSKDPFCREMLVELSYQENSFMIMDFHSAGNLVTRLNRRGRLDLVRARFYAVEIIKGCKGLHAVGVMYYDLKPENILIASDRHIVLIDF